MAVLPARADERPRLHPALAAGSPRPARDADLGVSGRSLHGARRPHPGHPQAARQRAPGVTGARVPEDVLSPFRGRPGRALMLGHQHPDADVLGTLLALGLQMESRGWTAEYGGPHPAPAALDFLPGVERYRVLARIEGAFEVVVLTD